MRTTIRANGSLCETPFSECFETNMLYVFSCYHWGAHPDVRDDRRARAISAGGICCLGTHGAALPQQGLNCKARFADSSLWSSMIPRYPSTAAVSKACLWRKVVHDALAFGLNSIPSTALAETRYRPRRVELYIFGLRQRVASVCRSS